MSYKKPTKDFSLLFSVSCLNRRLLLVGDSTLRFSSPSLQTSRNPNLSTSQSSIFPKTIQREASMATEAATTTASDLRPIPQPPDFHPAIVVPAQTNTNLKFYQLMVAGSIAGSVEHMAMFPVDTIKTHMQALRSCPIKPVGIRQAFRSIIKTDGPSALYRGIWAMGLGAGPAHAVYFSFYEVSKKFLSNGNPNNSAAHAVSGVFATIASDAVFTPMDMVKQRLQIGNGTYKGVWDCIKTVTRQEGFGAFYASYRTTVLMNAPFTAVHFATYEAVKRGLREFSPEHVGEDDESMLIYATAGAAAGGLAAGVTTPLDVIKTQLQCQGVCGCDRFKSSSISDVFRTIVKKDGYRGLARGWLPRMLFHAPAAAICWSTYEAAKSFFQDLNGNSA